MTIDASSIAGIIRQQAVARGETIALLGHDGPLDWKSLFERSARAASGFLQEGQRPQSRIAYLGRNANAFFELLFGAAMGNMVLVPVNWRLSTPEIVSVVNDSKAELLFVGPQYAALVDAVRHELETVRKIVTIENGPRPDFYERWLSRQTPEDPGAQTPRDDIAIQLYTSGTTGRPKGVMLSHRALMTCLDNGISFKIDDGTVSLVTLPIFHIGGTSWALMTLLYGGRCVLMEDFSANVALDLIEEHRITHLLLVPAAMLQMRAAPKARMADLSSLQLLVYGASPISENLLDQCLKLFGCDFYQTYGLTESSGIVTILPPGDHADAEHRDRLRSAGKPIANVALRIATAEHHDASDEEVGEVWIKSPQVMTGYWNNPEETLRAITEDGWLRTGDAGYLKEGYLYLFDRVKDMIVSGGENIYPTEIENVLMKHPAVADVAVIGVPSAVWGEEVKAIIVRRNQANITFSELTIFCRQYLGGYKVPKTIDFVTELPRNASGKLLKRELRAPYWKDRSRQIG